MSKIVTMGKPHRHVSTWEYRLPGEPEGFRSPAEQEAMTNGLASLMNLLTWARPHGSKGELDFMRTWLLPAIRETGRAYELDDFGNVWVSIARPEGTKGPAVLWSCHVDTVHAKDDRQGVRFQPNGRTIELKKPKPGRCLGADDGAGVWLLLEMMRAGVPGGYVFHRGEERGRLGSEHVAKHEPERLKPYDACVAFDRRDFADFITHQMGMRCASDIFAETMGGALNKAGHGLAYRPDDGGSYTDSFSYAEHISECANVSVGYDMEHGPKETLDGLHLWRLREALLSADFSGVVCERDPSAYGYDDWLSGYHGAPLYRNTISPSGSRLAAVADPEADEKETLVDLIRRYPRAVADLLGVYGMGCDELLDHMTENELAGALPMVAGGWQHD